MEQLLKGWTVEFHSGIPVYKQIINRITEAIANGELREGDQLPTIRALHEALNVNPNTVAKAYRELELKGVIRAEQGSGCYISPPRAEPQLTKKEKRARIEALLSRMAAEARSQGIRIEELMEYIQQKGKSHA
jgi:GntR family transcriptional regulator